VLKVTSFSLYELLFHCKLNRPLSSHLHRYVCILISLDYLHGSGSTKPSYLQHYTRNALSPNCLFNKDPLVHFSLPASSPLHVYCWVLVYVCFFVKSIDLWSLVVLLFVLCVRVLFSFSKSFSVS